MEVQYADPELAAMFSPPKSNSQTGAAVAARLRGEGYDWRPLLRAVSVPTLVIHGDRDLLPLSVAQDTVATLANAGWQVVPVIAGTELRRVWTRLGAWRTLA